MRKKGAPAKPSLRDLTTVTFAREYNGKQWETAQGLKHMTFSLAAQSGVGRTFHRSSRRVSLALLSVLVLAAVVGKAEISVAQEIRLGLVPANVFTAPAYAAEKLNYYKDVGLDVKFIVFRGGAAAQEAMTARQVDIIDYFGPAAALAITKGVKQKMVAVNMPGHAGWHVIVKADSPIKSIKDLAGKKIGISAKATTSDMAALWVADRAGIQMQQVPVGPAALAPALRAGQIDAVVFSAIVTNREMAAGQARSILELTDIMEPTIADAYVASAEMMEKRPADLRAFLAATLKGLEYMKANRAWSLAFLKDFAKIEDQQILELLQDKIIPRIPADGRIDRAWVDGGLKLAARAWDVPELMKVDSSAVFTNEFLPSGK